MTTIIPTLNEELHIVRAVESALSLGPVWVVDSLSTDRTCELAAGAGARVVEQSWLGHAAQKNWALDNLDFETEWIMFLDADEVLSKDLVGEIHKALEAASADAFQIPRRNIFLGTNLLHAWWYPDYQTRLFRLGTARYADREVHEHMRVEGIVRQLQAPLVHESLKGIEEFLLRHVRYARFEAAEMLASRDSGAIGPEGSDPISRRQRLKHNVWYKLPARPLIRYLWILVVRRGFLDGKAGRRYAGLIAAYEFMIDGFLFELDRKIPETDEMAP